MQLYPAPVSVEDGGVEPPSRQQASIQSFIGLLDTEGRRDVRARTSVHRQYVETDRFDSFATPYLRPPGAIVVGFRRIEIIAYTNPQKRGGS